MALSFLDTNIFLRHLRQDDPILSFPLRPPPSSSASSKASLSCAPPIPWLSRPFVPSTASQIPPKNAERTQFSSANIARTPFPRSTSSPRRRGAGVRPQIRPNLVNLGIDKQPWLEYNAIPVADPFCRIDPAGAVRGRGGGC